MGWDVSLQNEAADAVARTLAQCGFAQERALAGALVYLVDRLKNYREEGTPLRLEFFVFYEMHQDDLLRAVDADHRFPLGHGPVDKSTVAVALKRCALLAQDSWSAFLRIGADGKLGYGLLRHSLTVLYGNTEEKLKRDGIPSLPFVVVRQVEDNVVELQGFAVRTRIRFSCLPEETNYDAQNHSDSLLACLTADRLPGLRRDVRPYVRSLLQSALKRAEMAGAGILVGITRYSPRHKPGLGSATQGRVSRERQQVLPPVLARMRGVFDEWVIPTPLKVHDYLMYEDAPLDAGEVKVVTDVYAQLQAWMELIGNMLVSDGMVLFDTTGRVLGYRLFLEIEEQRREEGIKGGARRLAFEAMQALVAKGALVGAYFRSQDGRSKWVCAAPFPGQQEQTEDPAPFDSQTFSAS